jgi:hydrogenase nickel incorporation protein HypB
MCGTCGCSEVNNVKFHIHDHQHHHHDHDHDHDHDHNHHHHNHDHDHNHNQTIEIGQAILAKNDRLAERNRGYFLAHNLLVVNILSSPGSGKTTFLERTITDLKNDLKCGVIVGDLETDNDAQRLRINDTEAVQITTGTVCHLGADMVLKAAQKLNLADINLLFIENVGNLVCPAAYDLGEHFRVVLLSVTEGEDKPLKYPTMFKSADVVIVNKIDIAEAVEFDREKALLNIKKVAPQATIFEVSSRKGLGMENWYNYLKQNYQTEQLSA